MDTVKELVERGIRVYEQPGGGYWQQVFLAHPNEDYRKMGAMMYIAKTYDEFNNLTHTMSAEGGWCQIASYMSDWEITTAREAHPMGRGFWEAKETLAERRYFNHFWLGR